MLWKYWQAGLRFLNSGASICLPELLVQPSLAIVFDLSVAETYILASLPSLAESGLTYT